MIPAREALQRLRDGNRRFVSNEQGRTVSPRSAAGLAGGQKPFAIVLGCSDSRVPAELVFDQGFGDLFVIRVAGNIVAPSQVGSVEFAAELFGTQLVVVLGHSRCGAVVATLGQLRAGTAPKSRNILSIVDRVRPSLEELLTAGIDWDDGELLAHAVRANVRASANQLRHGSDVLERLIRGNRLAVVGAEYSLETGIVEFFDGVPDEPVR